MRNWKLSALTDFANALSTANDTAFTEAIDGPKKYFSDMGTSWQGAAYNSCYDRIDTDHTQARKLGYDVEDLATAIKNAATDIDSCRTVLLNKVDDAEWDHLRVADNWVVCSREGVSDDTLRTYQDAIDAALTPFENAVADARTKISAAAELVRSAGDLFGSDLDVNDAPAQAGRLGTEDAQALADATRNHDTAKIDEIASRLPALNLTDAQMQDLQQGKDVPGMPADIQDYYKQFFNHVGADGLSALNDRLDSQTNSPNPGTRTLAAAEQTDLATGFLAITNEHLGTGTNPDGTLQSPGSYTNLPPDIRQLISGREQDYIGNNPAGAPQRMKDREQLADMISKADPNMTGGRTLNTELGRQAQSMAQYLDDSGKQLPPGFTDTDRKSIDDAANKFLAQASRNHEADYQLLTGLDVNTGAKLPADMSFGAGGDQYAPHGNYDPDKFANTVYRSHTWGDGGKAAGDLYKWTGDHIHDPGANQPGNDGYRARAVVQDLPHVLSPSDAGTLVTSGGKTLFQQTAESFHNNPELANALAHVSASDINAFGNVGGAPDAPKPDAPLQTQDSERLAFLASETQQGRETLDQARQSYDNAVMYQINHDPTLSATDVHDRLSQLGALDAHVDDAIHNAQVSDKYNTISHQNQQAQDSHDQKQTWADNAKKLADQIPLPGGKIAGTVKSVLEDPAYKAIMDAANPQPTPGSLQYPNLEDSQNSGQDEFRDRMQGLGVSPEDQAKFERDHDDQYARISSDGLIHDNDSLNRFFNGGAQVPDSKSGK
ncbi:hypothetical protein ACIP5Y_00240 [Nocardia sp. NPDC088792]|uniref:TPR repeat region-containing protein n=1 Tax=Nocardia sp. NPDC088792 TaxID=3364332 RepID=UPI003808E0A4